MSPLCKVEMSLSPPRIMTWEAANFGWEQMSKRGLWLLPGNAMDARLPDLDRWPPLALASGVVNPAHGFLWRHQFVAASYRMIKFGQDLSGSMGRVLRTKAARAANPLSNEEAWLITARPHLHGTGDKSRITPPP